MSLLTNAAIGTLVAQFFLAAAGTLRSVSYTHLTLPTKAFV